MSDDHRRDPAALKRIQDHAWHGAGTRVLTLLVGASPLPNLLAALLLEPEEIAFIATDETEPTLRLLVKGIAAYQPGVRTRLFDGGKRNHLLVNAHSGRAIRECVDAVAEDLQQGVLFYTGGTKPMVAHVHASLTGKDRLANRACYLADRRGTLVFDDAFDGFPCVDAVQLTLACLADLHGLEELKTREDREEGDRVPNRSDGASVAGAYGREPTLPAELFRAASRLKLPGRETTAEDLRKVLGCAPETLELPEIACRVPGDYPEVRARLAKVLPELQLPERVQGDARLKWLKFLRGEWLELYMAAVLELPATGGRSGSVRSDIVGTLRVPTKGSGVERVKFQLDAARVDGARLFAVSCTSATGTKGRDHTKNKMFEVAARARQLGGDLARSAVVSLHDAQTTAELQEEVAARWVGDVPVTTIFGASHVREWIGSRYDSLSQWLKQ